MDDELPIDGDDDASDGEEKEEVQDLGIKFKLDKADISAFVNAGRKPPSATKNLLEDTDGLRRPPLERGGGDAIHQ